MKTLEKMVGAVRFELTTSCTPSKRAYQATLRPEPFRRMAPAEKILCRPQAHFTTQKSRRCHETQNPARPRISPQIEDEDEHENEEDVAAAAFNSLLTSPAGFDPIPWTGGSRTIFRATANAFC
jgi:hypothetical protein